jgi:thioredoxin 1
MISSIQTIDELKEAVTADDVVVVDLYASWCQPCQEMLPVIEELSEEIPLQFYKVDIDTVPDAKTFTGAKAVPMLLVYKDGRKREFAFGVTPKDKIKSKIERAIKF